MKKLILFLVLNIFFACGIKGPPLPPLATEPAQKQVTVNSTAAAATASGDATLATPKASNKKAKK